MPRTLALVGLLLFLAGHAQAQPTPDAIETRVNLGIAPLPDAVVPEGPFMDVPAVVTLAYLEVAPTATETSVQVSVAEGPPWAVLTVSPSTVLFPVVTAPCGCAQERTQEVRLLVSTTRDAPAFHPATVTLLAEAAPNGAYRGSNGTGSVDVAAGFLGRIEASSPGTTMRVRAGSTEAAPITVTNLGNAPILVTFSVQELASGIQVVTPPPLRLEALQTGAASNSATATSTVRAIASSGAHPFTLGLQSAFAGDPSIPGDSTIVAYVVEIPVDLGPLLALVIVAALVGAGFVTLRRRRKP